MKLDNLKEKILIITYAIGLLFVLINVNNIWSWISRVFFLLMPFIYGFAIAYVVNWAYIFFRKKVYAKIRIKNSKLIDILSLVSAYILVFGIILFLIIIIVPQLIYSIEQLINNFSMYVDSSVNYIDSFSNFFNLDIPLSYKLWDKTNNFITNIDNLTDVLLPQLFNITKTFTNQVYNWVIGIIVSFYLLGSKDRLLRQLKKLMNAVLTKKANVKILEISSLTHRTFGKFIIGKVINCIIIGILCFIGMSILRIPYPVLISVLMGFTNIIPFFGPFLGAIPSILILLIVDPIKALWFAIFILILQQIDGNIIGPKILGGSIGISGIWIMFSVIIGGGLFGIVGMILGVPVFAVIYIVFGRIINNKIEKNTESLS